MKQNDRVRALLGYERGPEDVWHMVEAARQALVNIRLSYALLPPSFESLGQKVRPSQQMVFSALAIYLDTSVLLASVLDAMELSTVVLYSQGSGDLAVWLLPNLMGTAMTRDLAALRSRVFFPRELQVVENTVLTGSKPVSLAYPVDWAEGALRQLTQGTFLVALWLASERGQGIRLMTEPLTKLNSRIRGLASVAGRIGR